MKTPLLLLPGLLADERLFRHQIQNLSDVATCTVADLTGADTIAKLASSAIASMPHGPFALAGLSMGGYVALEVMRQAGDRVAALALLNTNARPDLPESSENRRRLMTLADRDFAAVIETLMPKLLHPDHLKSKVLTQLVARMANAIGVEAFKRQQLAIIGREDSRPDLVAIRCPTLVVASQEDAIMPLDVSEEMAREIPGARLEVIDRCGHLSSLEQPAAVTALLRAWMPSAAG